MKKLWTAFAVLLLLAFLGCTSTKITSSWKAPDTTVKHFNKIMVVGIIREADRSIREKMENHVVGDLRNMGYVAMSSYSEFGPKAFETLNEEQINEKMREQGADGVLTIVLLNKEKEKYYVPERVVFSPYFVYYNRFGRYYTTLYSRIESPGYYEVATKYFWESNLYDLATRQLVYSVQTQSFDPSSSETLAHEYGRLIVENMVAQHVLRRQSAGANKAM